MTGWRHGCASFLLAPFVLAPFALSCGGAKEEVATLTAGVVYGEDDRREYFELDPRAEGALLSEVMVALVDASGLQFSEGGSGSVSYGERFGLCQGERFAEQPAAAFCSGILVDWDLILTAGHCLRVLPLSQIRVVFGYFYEEPWQLFISPSEVIEIETILAERMDPSFAEPRLDYAWLRLARTVDGARRPARVRIDLPTIGEPIVSLASPGGVPLKGDLGGQVRFVSGFSDYFRADTDTSHGSSGGGAFDASGSLFGVLSRGGSDFVTADGETCRRTRHVTTEVAEEEFTLVGPALDGLCAAQPDASSLCGSNCQSSCEALPLVQSQAIAGCALSLENGSSGGSWIVLLGLALAVVRRRKPSVAFVLK